MAIVAVPEAAINEDKAIPWTQNDVGTARNAFDMKTIANSRSTQNTADMKLRTGILALDAGHHEGALNRRNNIRH